MVDRRLGIGTRSLDPVRTHVAASWFMIHGSWPPRLHGPWFMSDAEHLARFGKRFDPMTWFWPGFGPVLTRLRYPIDIAGLGDLARVNTQRFIAIWLSIEDVCLSIKALRDVSSLVASIALKKN
jgi:hypothetical protein